MKRPLAIVAALAVCACANKTAYIPPAPAEMPAGFKENPDWKTAQPADQTLKGTWWEIFQDDQLNVLERQIDVSNQTLKAQQARFAQARAAIRVTRADRFPQVTTSPSITVTESSANL
ncbi:MAG TPA: hypothetical protein VGF24_02020, partial [Vicinamibacterales bacterium]